MEAALTSPYGNELHGLFFGPSSIGNCLKDLINHLDYSKAMDQQGDLHTILQLTFHINYYACGVKEALEGKPLSIRDSLSWNCERIHSQEQWNLLKESCWDNAKQLILLVESLEEDGLKKNFDNGKYGSIQQNLNMLLQHSYYHVGQIALLIKLNKSI